MATRCYAVRESRRRVLHLTWIPVDMETPLCVVLILRHLAHAGRTKCISRQGGLASSGRFCVRLFSAYAFKGHRLLGRETQIEGRLFASTIWLYST